MNLISDLAEQYGTTSEKAVRSRPTQKSKLRLWHRRHHLSFRSRPHVTSFIPNSTISSKILSRSKPSPIFEGCQWCPMLPFQHRDWKAGSASSGRVAAHGIRNINGVAGNQIQILNTVPRWRHGDGPRLGFFEIQLKEEKAGMPPTNHYGVHSLLKTYTCWVGWLSRTLVFVYVEWNNKEFHGKSKWVANLYPTWSFPFLVKPSAAYDISWPIFHNIGRVELLMHDGALSGWRIEFSGCAQPIQSCICNSLAIQNFG